ncbi:MAG: hypothetical protein ACC656_04700 [Candidatus Heimdallarchaeota archaeon]
MGIFDSFETFFGGESKSEKRQKRRIRKQAERFARAQERYLGEQEVAVRRQGQRLDNLFKVRLGVLGFSMDAQGNIIKGELTATQQKQAKITSLLQDREIAALEGRLPIGSAVEQKLKDFRAAEENRLKMQHGPGYASTSQGIIALNKLNETEAAVRDRAQRGDLTTVDQLLSGQNVQGLQEKQFQFGGLGGVSNPYNAQLGHSANLISLSSPFGYFNQVNQMRQLQQGQQRTNFDMIKSYASIFKKSGGSGAGGGGGGSMYGGGGSPSVGSASQGYSNAGGGRYEYGGGFYQDLS